MKSISFVFCFLAFISFSTAQVQIGVNIQPGFSNYSFEKDYVTPDLTRTDHFLAEYTKAKFVPSIGIQVRKQFTEKMAVSTGLNYRQMGSQFDTEKLKKDFGENTADRSISIIESIGIPVQFQYAFINTINNGFSFTFGSGISYAYSSFTKTKVKTPPYQLATETEKTFHSISPSSLILPLQFQLNYSTTINDQMGIEFGPYFRGNIGLSHFDFSVYNKYYQFGLNASFWIL